MPDLIAQGRDPQQRWRRRLAPGRRVVLGREAAGWATPWDDRISRQHAEAVWDEAAGELQVKQIATARNPIFFQGQQSGEFTVRPGQHFVIGGTSFMLADDQAQASLDVPAPQQEQAFSQAYLRRLQFRHADQRIDVLSRLTEVISGATSDIELHVRLVSLLLTGVAHANAAAVVRVEIDPAKSSDDAQPQPAVCVLHWDRRLTTGGPFVPSQRLIQSAVERGESVLHTWQGGEEGAAYTVRDNVDWAFCTPVPGDACRGWALYLSGSFVGDFRVSASGTDPSDLRDDVKFVELAASTLGALRQAQMLTRRTAGLGQFFSPVVLEALANDDPDVVLAPREAEVSVLFCDLRGFSLRSEQAAGDLTGLLNRVSQALGVMTHEILKQGGVVGDFHGDAAMGFWGWPIATPDAIQRTCLAALGVRAQFAAAAFVADHPLADFRMGIGIATGRAVAGKIGTADQVKVTVFGPVVNLASRLEGMTKIFHAPILLDRATADAVRQQVPSSLARVRRVAVVQPYGLERPLEISELLPPAAEHPQLSDEHLRAYEAALDALIAGRWAQAFELLHRVPADDQVKDFLTVLIARHHRTPPADWQGVIRLESKL